MYHDKLRANVFEGMDSKANKDCSRRAFIYFVDCAFDISSPT